MKENIKSFCVNNYQNSNEDLMVLTNSNRRLQKFKLLKQLINKTRTNDGITLIDEVLFNKMDEVITKKTIKIQWFLKENLNDDESETVKNQLENMENKPFIVKLAKNLLFSSTNSSLDENILYSRNKHSYFNYYSPSEINEIIDVFSIIFLMIFF